MEYFNPISAWSLMTQPSEIWAQAFASANIALVKYWGKRDSNINLPTHSSLSLSLGRLGTTSAIRCSSSLVEDIYWLNGIRLEGSSAAFKRLQAFLNPFRPQGCAFELRSENNIPTAAGLASSASSYAALVMALDKLFEWDLSPAQMSLLARLGSGSASRSVYLGFAIWHAGIKANGEDSFAQPLDERWPQLRWAVVVVDSKAKVMSSRQAMSRCIKTCAWFDKWPDLCVSDLQEAKVAITNKDFQSLGDVMERSALTMHATMLSSSPPIVYWQAQTLAAMHKVYELRSNGIPCYFTIDAGPNLKILYQHQFHDSIACELEKLERPVLYIDPWSVNDE